MHDVANVNSNLQFDPAIRCDIMVPLGQGPLDFDGALRRFQRAPELDQERVPNSFDFRAVKPRENFAQ